MYALFILPEVTKMATDLAVDYIAKRFVSAAADEIGSKASSIGASLLGGFFDSRKDSVLEALYSPGKVKEMIEQASNEIGVSLVDTNELAALLKIAEAIENKGDVAGCHEAWKKIAKAKRQAT